MSEYKLFVQRIGLVGITNILVGLSSIILLPILTKSLTITDYGIWSLFNSTFVFIPLLINLGLPYTMVRFLAVKNDKEEIKEEFYSITLLLSLLGIIAFVLMFLISKPLAVILFNGNVAVSQLLAVGVLIAVISSSFFSFFRTFQQMKLYSILLLVQTYFGMIIVTLLVLYGYSIAGAVLGYVISQFIIMVLSGALVVRQIGFKFPKFENIREYLSFGIPTVPGNLSNWLVDQSDRVIIGIFLGSAFVGYYSPSYTICSVILMLMAPFSLLLTPLLSSYYDRNEIEEVKIHLNYSLKYFMLLAIPTVFGLSILSKPVLTVLSTSQIAQNSYLITPFVAVSLFLVGIYGITSQILVLEKKTKIIGSLWMISAAINVVLNIIFVPHFGIVAAAISTLAAYGFVFAVSLFYSQKYIEVKFEWAFILKCIFASILMSIAIIIINPVSFIGILVTIGIGTVIYMVIVFLLKGISSTEIEFFKKMVRG